MIAKLRKRKPYSEPPTNLNGYDPLRDADGFDWSPHHANQIVDFFQDQGMLILTSGKKAGQPFRLEKWQADYLATLNGWRGPGDLRRYRESLLAVPRKNGKTELAAGLALFLLCADNEQRAQIYSAAKDRNQSSLVFEPAAFMARRSPVLAKRLAVTLSRKRIEHPESASYYQALASDAGAIHGTNPHAVLFDELHTQPNRNLYDVLKSGMGARQHPLYVSMTTAGHERESICYEVWQHALRVRDGLFDPTFLPLVYQLDTTEDWKSEDNWRKVNPNLGVTISEKFLRDEFLRAKETPAYENTFRNLYLNQWTEQAVRWLSLDHWDSCGGSIPDLDGEPCWAGLDLSSSVDISAFVLAFPVADQVAIMPHFWISEEQAKRNERSDRVPYQEWARRGLVTVTPGNVVDYDRVRSDIVKLGERYSIQEIAADRWNATQIITQLSGDGFNIFSFGQGYASMSGPSKEFEKLILGKHLIHSGNPVLRWMACNVATTSDAAGNIKPVKDMSTGRIDGIVASIMAVGRCLGTQSQRWFYDTNKVEIG